MQPEPTETAFTPAPGEGGLHRLVLSAADGARAELYLHGAQLVSWRVAGSDDERLFVSPRARFAQDFPIRGGIPLCFPQFAGQGPLPQHGFARISAWRIDRAGRTVTGAAQAVLRLCDSSATRALWPHAFAAELTVTLAGSVLEVGFSVTNTGAAPFSFTGALHTYLAVIDLHAVAVHGLSGARYRDKALGGEEHVERADALRIDREIDRVYLTAPADVEVREPGRATALRARGFPDTVVWNPDAARAASIGDLGAGGHERMLCIEAAVARAPVEVGPGVRWEGAQQLCALR